MRLKLVSILFTVLVLVAIPQMTWSQNCADLFVKSADTLIKCDAACEDPATLAHKISALLERRIDGKTFDKKTRGYILITAAMVTSAAISTHLTAELPKDMAFLSHLVGQVSTIGIFVLGAPIWEPISSAFRKFAFGLGVEKQFAPTSDPTLEKLWQRTQGQYSLNAQMSRNVIHSFLLAAQANFNSARVAMNEGSPELAIDLIAETAVRLRRLFGEIDPQDPSVTLAIRSTFTRHVEQPARMRAEIRRRIEEADPESQSVDAQLYYETLLRTWID